MSELSPQEHVDARILAYYGTEFDEGDRLVDRSGQGALEFERTQQIVGEHVPAGSRIIDIGGASGLHAAALAERGDTVVLIDPVTRHVEAACRYGTFTAKLGDARSLPVDDDSFDAAMLLGRFTTCSIVAIDFAPGARRSGWFVRAVGYLRLASRGCPPWPGSW